MGQRVRTRAAVVLGCALATACLQRPAAAPPPNLQAGVQLPIANTADDQVDILFEIDNSDSMIGNQTRLAAELPVLINGLVNPPRDPTTMRPLYPPVQDLHVGVISSDLGTPGSNVQGCANSDLGDDGLLNPIRQGQAMRAHQPWTNLATRPLGCAGTDPNEFPVFLTFDANRSDPVAFSRDFACTAFLSTGGCLVEQQLESVYRALVVHNPRDQAGNYDPNRGFLRDRAILAIVIVSDEDDGSTRDCRFAERDADGNLMPCDDALGVFDATDDRWPPPINDDINIRFYRYAVGSRQDPTWPIDRYVDPSHPRRGFLGLKPEHPERVIFSAIAGVPIGLPRLSTGRIDWTTLLGTTPDGADAFAASPPEGPISMRRGEIDPTCTTRVVPACRDANSREPTDRTRCDHTTAQYYALPSRRIAQVARVFDEQFHSGTISSICQQSYAGALQEIVERIQSQLRGRCLPRALEPVSTVCCSAEGLPYGCSQSPSCDVPDAISVQCRVIETLPAGMPAATWCTPDHGRRALGTLRGRAQCEVLQVAAPRGGRPADGSHGFFYDTSPDPAAPECGQRISFTTNDSLPVGAEAVIDCVQNQVVGGSR